MILAFDSSLYADLGINHNLSFSSCSQSPHKFISFMQHVIGPLPQWCGEVDQDVFDRVGSTLVGNGYRIKYTLLVSETL